MRIIFRLSVLSSPSLATYFQQNQLYLDNQFVTDLYAEVIGTLAQSRFTLVKRRFLIEFDRLKLNISSNSSIQTNQPINNVNLAPNSSPGSNQVNISVQPSVDSTASTSTIANSTSTVSSATTTISPTSANIIKLLMGMKYFRIKMVPIEDFEASFQFLNDCAQYFLEVKDKDVKYTLAGLFVEILVPITGSVKNEVNIPCLKQFVDILYPHAFDLCAKSKHRLAMFPLLTCLLCVSQKQFFLTNWFTFTQLCLQQFKSREQTLARISLESVLRLVWVYMIRVKGEKSSETNQRLQLIAQTIFPRGSKLVTPKDMPAPVYVKLIHYVAYEKLDFAMKEIIYELLAIDVNSGSGLSSSGAASLSGIVNNDLNSSSGVQTGVGQDSKAFKLSKDNLALVPLRMEIGLRAFVLIADNLQQQKESNTTQPPSMPMTFNLMGTEPLSVYLGPKANKIPSHRLILNDALCREIGLGAYFDNVRRVFQVINETIIYQMLK